MTPVPGWTRRDLTRAGFEGWVAWSACPGALEVIPTAASGVYVVLRPELGPPVFREKSSAGLFREDPSVELSVLELNWVEQAHVLYIGKAEGGRLRKTLREDVRFGRGHRVRFSYGRLIWQLDGAQNLLVAWLETDDYDEQEARLLKEFRAAYGQSPFANSPKLMGR
jgi:hypothetical protein